MITGEHNPIYGIIQLDEDYTTMEDDAVDKQAAYVHERIHFIQNYTTLYGMNKSIYLLSDTLDHINKIRIGQPTKVRNVTEDFVVTSYEILLGDDKLIENCSILKVDLVNEEKDFYRDDFQERIEYLDYLEETVLITLDDGSTYRFGGMAISESMAYLVEEIVFSSCDYENCLPYNACGMLYEFVVGQPCKNKAALFALAHLSLMSKAPGKTFYHYLLHIKLLELDVTIEDVYRHFYRELRVPNETNMSQLFERIDMIFPSKFDEISGDDFFAVHREKIIYANQWVKELYQELNGKEEELRKALWAILGMNSENDTIQKRLLFGLLEQYGNSIVLDKQGKLYDEDDNKLMLFAPVCLCKTIFNKERECYLRKACLKYSNNVDWNCFDGWWNHKPSNSVCLMQYYLYIMGLQEIDFGDLRDLSV